MATKIPPDPQTLAKDEMYSSCELEINRCFDELDKALQQRRNLLLAKLYQLKEQRELQAADEQRLLNEMEIAQSLINNSKHNTMLSHIDQLVDNINKDLGEINLNQQEVVFTIETFDIVSKIQLLGNIVSIPQGYAFKSKSCAVIGSYGTQPLNFDAPWGLHIDKHQQRLYVADTGNQRIQVLNSNTYDFIEILEIVDLKSPWGITTFDKHVYVTDFQLKCVFKYDTIEKNFHRSSQNNVTQGTLRGIAHDPNGTLYICETDYHRIVLLTNDLVYESHMGTGLLNSPFDIKIYSDNIIVADFSAEHIHLFNKSGDLIKSMIPYLGGNFTLFKCALLLTVDFEGNILFRDGNRKDIKIYSINGELLQTLKLDNGRPSGVVVGTNCQVIIADSNNHRLSVF